jgi:hypothetical protein
LNGEPSIIVATFINAMCQQGVAKLEGTHPCCFRDNRHIKIYFIPFTQSLQTNVKGRYKMGDFHERCIGNGTGLPVKKGERIGHFNLGSSVVLIFEAPENFEFRVEPGQTVKYGQPLGSCRSQELESIGQCSN